MWKVTHVRYQFTSDIRQLSPDAKSTEVTLTYLTHLHKNIDNCNMVEYKCKNAFNNLVNGPNKKEVSNVTNKSNYYTI